MIKYFHRLTEDEFQSLADKELVWSQVAEDYPQPKWCSYPDAVNGALGCFSLMYYYLRKKMSHGYCRGCRLYIKKQDRVKGD